MTTIIAIQHADHVVMMADSQINSDGRPYVHPDMTKIIDTGKHLIGVAGDVTALQAFHHLWKPPAPTSRYRGSAFDYVVQKIIPSLRTFIAESKIFTDKEKDDGASFQMLIAINGQVFEIDEALSVAIREDGFFAIGSGAPYAIGAICAGANVHQAMEIAEQNDVNTGAPFITRVQMKLGK